MRFLDVFFKKECGFADLCSFLIPSCLEEPKIKFLVLLKLMITFHQLSVAKKTKTGNFVANFINEINQSIWQIRAVCAEKNSKYSKLCGP